MSSTRKTACTTRSSAFGKTARSSRSTFRFAKPRNRNRALIELASWRGESDDPARLIALVDAWAASAALLELVAAFGAVPPRGDRLLWLDQFSAEHWDFRGGRERNLAAAVSLTPRQEAVVRERAPELGLADRERPSALAYDTVLMTGGMVRAGIVKPRQVASLIAHGVRFGEIVFLGADRTFAGDEPALATALGVNGDTECAAMVAGMEQAFGDGWADIEGADLSVVAAPSMVAGRRANTADTFQFWAAGREPQRMLIVTTPIYVPYQAAVATEVLGLGHGHSVETVGTSALANDLGEHTQQFLASHHLQELRSAIRGMMSLRAAAVASARGAARG